MLWYDIFKHEEIEMKNVDIEINELKLNLMEVCNKNTCYPQQQSEWTKENPFLGHCAVVALTVYKHFGGKIMRGVIKETGVSHYWNNVNDKDYDLTKEQFKNKITIVNVEDVSVYRLLNNPDTANRFLELNKQLDNFIFTKKQKEQSR